MSRKKSERMDEISFFEHLKTWVYMPFASVIGLIVTIYWRLRMSDRKELSDQNEEIKSMLRGISGDLAVSNTNFARLDERVKTLFEQRRTNG